MIGKLQYRNGKIDKENVELVEEKAKILQKLYASVNDYFASLYSGGVLTEEQASQSAGMQYILCDIDRIGQLTREIMETVAKQNKGKHKYSKDALKELKKAMEQIQMIFGSCIQAISGDVNMDIKELMRQKEDIMQLGEPDASGRRSPIATGETLTIECDQVIVAVGVSPNPLVPKSIPGLELGRKNTIVVNEQMQSSRPELYAGGDIVRGGATVILAMGDGRRAAKNMAERLINMSNDNK